MNKQFNLIDDYMPNGPDPVTIEPCEHCRETGFEMIRIEPKWFWQKPTWKPTICSNCHGYKVADWRFQYSQDRNRRSPTKDEASMLLERDSLNYSEN
jgi:hypothetical protein